MQRVFLALVTALVLFGATVVGIRTAHAAVPGGTPPCAACEPYF